MKRIYIFLLLTMLFSCKKEELVTVGNNQPPEDYTIEPVVVENYINRTYILTLGREPDETEFNSARQSLMDAGVDSTSRQNFLQDVFSDASYAATLYNQSKIDLLNNIDTSEFTLWITIFQNALNDTSNQASWPYIHMEQDRLISLRNAFPEFISGTINIDELQRRMCNNYLYDQINMGAANFVISTFQHLINRNPTGSEQQNGINMVGGINAILFLESGSTKNDYLDILTHASNYYESQVVLLYRKFLNRDPNSDEMLKGTQKYSSTGDYTAVQKDILSTNEFIGIE
ncbi:MAG TPA: hypothetical protein PKL85_02960 [Bacteroidia bacterium]|nr:hypothetical protein [Bacteroidia bacterium]